MGYAKARFSSSVRWAGSATLAGAAPPLDRTVVLSSSNLNSTPVSTRSGEGQLLAFSSQQALGSGPSWLPPGIRKSQVLPFLDDGEALWLYGSVWGVGPSPPLAHELEHDVGSFLSAGPSR